MITITWPNGHKDEAPDWRRLEASVRADQWWVYRTRLAFRRDMSLRALVWSGRRPSRATLLGSSERFMKALSRCEMYEITEVS